MNVTSILKPDPIDQLTRLKVACSTAVLPPDLAKWLESRLDAYLAGGTSIDAVLGLTVQPGKRSIVYEMQVATRNDYLCRLFCKLKGSTWAKSGQIAAWNSEFMAYLYPIMRYRELDASDLAGVDIPRHRLCFLREASRPGLPLPVSQGRIHELLKDSCELRSVY